MRPLALCVLLVLSTASASAQRTLSPPTVEDGLLLALAVSGTGVTAATFVGPYAPVPMTVALFGTSSALGLRPSVPGVLLDAAIGFGVGRTTGALYADTHDGPWTEVEALMVGGAVGAAAAATSHVVRLRWLRSDRVSVAPVALTAPTGDRSGGLRVEIGL